MILQKCAVKACGATVLIVKVEGRPFPVNPAETELVIPEPGGEFRVVRGYQPHGGTCVDIEARLEPPKPFPRGE